jgi:hypothetical protein
MKIASKIFVNSPSDNENFLRHGIRIYPENTYCLPAYRRTSLIDGDEKIEKYSKAAKRKSAS